MRRLRRIFWLGLREALSFRRDAVMVALMVWSFTFAVVVESTGVSSTVSNASIAVADEDGSALSRAIAGAFLPPEFRTVERIAPDAIDAGMDAGRWIFVLDVPPRFQADVLAGRSPAVQLLIDATAMQQAGIGASYVSRIVAQEVGRFATRADPAAATPAALVTRSAFNPNGDTRSFQAVISLIGHITTMTVLLTGAALIREREHGTVEHLLAMPLAPVDIALAKIWANGGLVLAASVLSLVLVVEGGLGVHMAGSRGLFLAGAALYMFSATALGVFLATLARSMAQFALLFILVIIPMELLSGGSTPVEGQPAWLRPLTWCLPSRHFVSFGQAILFKGAGIATVWPDFAAVLALGLGLLGLSLALFRRSVAED